MNIRQMIRQILLEKKKFGITDSSGAGMDGEFDYSAVDDVINIISSGNVAQYGYNIVSVEQSADTSVGAMQVEIILQHVGPDFKKFIDQLSSRGGRFATIYGDTPKSKTMITRWLTGFKDGALIDARQKSAAIKVAQLAGLEALQPILDQIEAKYDVTCVANFTGAKTRKKGQSFFEIFVMPQYVPPGEAGIPGDELPDPPEQPESVPVDGEEIEVPADPAPVRPPVSKPPKKPKAPKKPRKKRGKKKPKLTAKQRKAGYNQINARGDIRHVLDQTDLQDVDDHIVELMFGANSRKIDELGPGDAADAYTRLRNQAEANDLRNDQPEYVTYRVVDDYFDNPLPQLVFYKCNVYGGKVNSRVLMSAYTSFGSDRYEDDYADEDLGLVRKMFQNPKFGVDKSKEFTPPKLGSKKAKDIRRYTNLTKTNDELIIYALVERKVNRYTGIPSKHTGNIMLYVFQLDRNFPEEV